MKRTNKIFALVMAFIMGLTVATPLFAQTDRLPVAEDGIYLTPEQEFYIFEFRHFSEEEVRLVVEFMSNYDKQKKKGDQVLKEYLQQEFSKYVYVGNSEEISPLTQSIIDQNADTFITLYEGYKDNYERIRKLRDALLQFKINE